MSATDVSICNLALSRIGVSIGINALDEGSAAADKCAVLIEHVREKCLDELDWDFASARANLVLTGTAPTGFNYQYAIPTDCVAPREIVYDGVVDRISYARPYELNYEGGLNTPYKRVQWKTAYDPVTESRVILTDKENAELRYTRLIRNPSVYPNYFVEMFAWSMAMELIAPMAANANFAKLAQDAYDMAKLRAQAFALEGSEEGGMPDSEFIQARA